MRDFTLQLYTSFIESLKGAGYSFHTFQQFIEKPLEKVVILRHDVDKLPLNALKTARIESSLGVRGTYYFRAIPSIYKEEIICQIRDLGHEIGYHYETMDSCKGKIDKAYSEFCKNLETFRKIYPVKTICMHGSPTSMFDNRDIWKKYNYQSLGIIAEPYFDVDYSKVFYITDTGRKWNNQRSNVRDIVNSSIKIHITSTNHLISLIEQEKLPNYIMINTHPHRWFDMGFGWYKEYVGQNLKNIIKRILLNVRNGKK